MALSLIGTTLTTGATGSFPSGIQAGDLVLAYAAQGSSTTVPTLASGYQDVGSRSGNTTAMRTAYRVYQAGDASPTFSGSDAVMIEVYRGQDLSDPIGAYNNNNASSSTITFPALTPFDNTNGTSWFSAAVVGNRPDVVIPAPSGTTQRQQSGTRPGWLLVDTNGGVTTWAQHTVTVSRAAGYTVCQVEIKAKPTVTVGISRALPYKAIGNVQVQRDLPYKVRLFVQAQRDLLYEITSTVGIARNLPSAIRKFVEVSRTLPYTLTETPTNEIVGITRNLPWQVSGLVSVQRRMPYKIRQFISAARSIPYKIRAFVGVSRTLKWTDRVLAAVSRTLPWKTRVFVSVSRTVAWTDKLMVSIVRRVPTRVLGLAQIARVLRWVIHPDRIETDLVIRPRVRVDTDPTQVEIGAFPDQVHISAETPQVGVEFVKAQVVIQPVERPSVLIEDQHPVVRVGKSGYAVRVGTPNPVVKVKENN